MSLLSSAFYLHPSSVSAGASGPLLLGFTPADNATSVSPSSNLTLSFDENVVKGTGSASVHIRRVADNSLFESFQVASSGRVWINDSNRSLVTIDPTSNFTVGDHYYVLIDAGAFRNEAGQNYAGLASATAWNFSVGEQDGQPPVLLSRTGTVNSGEALRMIFDEAVYAASGVITITNSGDSSDVQAINVVSSSVTGSGTTTIRIQPAHALRAGQTYRVTVPGGAFQDASGNNFAGVSSGWTLAVNNPPIAMPALAPADNAAGVPSGSALVMTFAIPMAKGTSGAISIKKITDNSLVSTIPVTSPAVSVAGHVVTIQPSVGFAANTGYYVLVDTGAFTDAATGSLPFQGISDASAWNFTTSPAVDNVKPAVTEYKPANNGSQAALSVPLELKFSEPVYPGIGNIVIKNAANDMIQQVIPVTSSQVVGGGSAEIKITPSAFVNNTTYYVQIGSQAFRDAAGNNYSGIPDGDKTTWRFTVTQDALAPTIAVMSPPSGSNSVPVNATFTAIFNEPIQAGSMSAQIKRRGATPGTVAVSAAIDTTDPKKLILTPQEPLAANTAYFMEIAPGAVKDMGNNDFTGILNEFHWPFQTVGSDTAAPVVSAAAMSGSTTVVLTFNESLDPSSVPLPANFYVTVNNFPRTVTTAAINGSAVTLTLQSGVAAGQVVKVSYSVGTAPIQDLSGNKATSFADKEVTNSPDSTLPRLVAGTANGSVVMLQFSEPLQDLHANAYNQFSVIAGGSPMSVTMATVSGDTVYLVLSSSLASGQSVTAGYTPGSYPIRDLSGNAAQAFSSFNVQNGQDTTAPVLQTAVASGGQIVLTYNEGIKSAFAMNSSQFAVTVEGAARNISSVTVSGNQVTLVLGAPVSAGQRVFVSYLGGSPALTDISGNAAPVFNGISAGNSSGSGGGGGGNPGPGTIVSGATAKGSEVTLTFQSQLRSGTSPSIGQFIVKAQGTNRSISGLTVGTHTVVLQLSTPIKPGESVTVSYYAMPSTPGLVLWNGEQVTTFTDVTAVNQTQQGDGLSGDLTSADGGGVAFKTNIASTSLVTSPGGSSVSRYVIPDDKLAMAFEKVRSGGITVPRVVFAVPDTEKAGIVALSPAALEQAFKQASNASFAIQYKGWTYEVPLGTLDFIGIGQAMLSMGGQSLLQLEIETDSSSLTGALGAALAKHKATTYAGPVHFSAAVVAGSSRTPLDSFKGYTVRSVKSAMALNPREVAAVWLDPETGLLSYVPTHVDNDAAGSLITFKRTGNSAYAVIKGSINYTDIGNHWARNDILLLANKFIVDGRTASQFQPEKPVTRGEFAAFIARGLGLSGDKKAAARFKDVNPSTAMAAYIGAATKAGIVVGNQDGTFKPNDPITRQEIAIMTVRATEKAGANILLSRSQSSVLAKFKDQKQIASWSATSVAKAVEAGIINGVAADKFSPAAKATRAQAAVMIERLLDYAKFLDT